MSGEDDRQLHELKRRVDLLARKVDEQWFALLSAHAAIVKELCVRRYLDLAMYEDAAKAALASLDEPGAGIALNELMQRAIRWTKSGKMLPEDSEVRRRQMRIVEDDGDE